MRQGIEIVRGTSNKFQLTITDMSSNLYELGEDEAIVFGVKEKLDDEEYVVLKIITSGEDGVFEVCLCPEDTAEVEPGKYFYDVGLQSGDEFYNVIPADTFLVLPNVTKCGVTA